MENIEDLLERPNLHEDAMQVVGTVVDLRAGLLVRVGDRAQMLFEAYPVPFEVVDFYRPLKVF